MSLKAKNPFHLCGLAQIPAFTGLGKGQDERESKRERDSEQVRGRARERGSEQVRGRAREREAVSR